jgi:glycosyltransferase involved in cell wall biosynthesis
MRISYVNGICVQHDAISNAIREKIQLFLQVTEHDVRLYAYACEYGDIPFTKVESAADIALDSHFQSSDLVVFHFGVYYPLFDLLSAVPARAKCLVVFHNITPKEVLPREQWPTIERSQAQLANVVWADHVLCDSHTNLAALRAASITTPASVLPLPVMTERGPAAKPSFSDGATRIAFLGRFVRSKGPHDLLAALSIVMESLPPEQSVTVDMIGNLVFSDQGLLEQIRADALGLQTRFRGRLKISLHGNVSDQSKRDLLQAADLFVLPTYHEGFCVPIIEAMADGCVVVTYDNSNTPAITGGLALLTPTGDIVSLALALRSAMEKVASNPWRSRGYLDYLERAWLHVQQFEPSRISRRFLRFIDTFMCQR